jgi:hypothetical protein
MEHIHLNLIKVLKEVPEVIGRFVLHEPRAEDEDEAEVGCSDAEDWTDAVHQEPRVDTLISQPILTRQTHQCIVTCNRGSEI